MSLLDRLTGKQSNNKKASRAASASKNDQPGQPPASINSGPNVPTVGILGMGAAQSIQGQGQNNNNFYAGGESAAQPGTGQAGVTAIAPFNFIVSGQGGLAGSYASGASGTGQPLQLETWVKFKDGQHLLPDWVVEITGGQAVYNSPEFKAKAEKITFAKYMAAFSRQQASASLPTREAIAGNHLAAIRDLESGRLPAPTNKLGWDMRSRIK